MDHIPARAPGLRRVALAALAALLSISGLGASAGASTKSQLAQARARLQTVERRISSDRHRLAVLQQEEAGQRRTVQTEQVHLNALATRIDQEQTRYDQTLGQIQLVGRRIQTVQAQFDHLRSRLDERARAAYEQGPGSGFVVLLSATSLADLAYRSEFVSAVAQYDQSLANEVQNKANLLKEEQSTLEGLLRQQSGQLTELRREHGALDSRFARDRRIFQRLASERVQAARLAGTLAANEREISGLIGRLKSKLRAQELARARRAMAAAAAASQSAQGFFTPSSGSSSSGSPSGISGPNPFAVCPVAGPHGLSDDFGAPRVGHLHMGIDIDAATGTPIVAPFPGNAVSQSGGAGGNAVIVYGSQGYVYNAHLTSFGTLGNVSTGTVIGYVGSTGDATGPHDHFEWHPKVLPSHLWVSPYGQSLLSGAIDSYPYLLQVC